MTLDKEFGIMIDIRFSCRFYCIPKFFFEISCLIDESTSTFPLAARLFAFGFDPRGDEKRSFRTLRECPFALEASTCLDRRIRGEAYTYSI